MPANTAPPPRPSRDFEEDPGQLSRQRKARQDETSGLLSGIETGIRGRLANPHYVNSLYSGAPEANVIVKPYGRGYRVKRMLDYVARIDTDKKEDVGCEDELSIKLKGEKDVLALYDRWKKDFEKYPPRGLTRHRRDAAHIILSSACPPSEENEKKVLAAARSTMARELGSKGYEYVSALHRDSGNLHVHFIVKCKNRFEGQPKLRLNPKELFQMRTQFAWNLTRVGLEHVATLKQDRPNIMEHIKDKVENLTKNERQFQRAMRRAAPTRNAFLYRKSASRTISQLREQVKKQTKPKSPERLQLLGELRKIERKLTKNRPGIEKEVAASFRQNSRDFQKLNKFIDQAAKTPKKKEQDRQSLDKLVQKHKYFLEKNLELARDHINKSDMSDQARKDSLYVLSMYEKDMKKALEKGPVSYDITESKRPETMKTKGLIYGERQGLADKFEPLNKIVKNALDLAATKPAGAEERQAQNKQIQKAVDQIREQVATARKTIKTMKMDPAMTNDALKNLRDFHKQVVDKLHGRDQVQKKRVVPQDKLAKMKALYTELKKMQPKSEKGQQQLKKRLAELESAMRKEIKAIRGPAQGKTKAAQKSITRPQASGKVRQRPARQKGKGRSR